MSTNRRPQERSRPVARMFVYALLLLLVGVGIAVIAALVTLVAGGDEPDTGALGPEQTIVAVLDVGQGLSVAVITPDGHSLLYDAGNGQADADEVILPFFREYGIDQIDYLVLSHPHQDHVGGMPAILDAMPVGTFVDPVIETTNQAYGRTLESVIDNGINAQRARRGDQIDLGSHVSVEILWPRDPLLTEPSGEESINDNSVVLRLTHDNLSVLLTGDIERSGERELVELDGRDLEIDILQIAHHGSRTSTTDDFLRMAHPAVAVISAGADNRYGHPHDEVVQRLRAEDVRIYRTDVDGSVIIAMDGHTFEVGIDGAAP